MQTPTHDISVTHTNIHHTHVARVVEQFRFDSVRSEVRLFFNVNYRELPETHNWFLINCSFAFVVLEGFISEIYSLKVSWCAIQRIYPKRIHKVLECSDCVAHALSNRTCWLVTGDWITSIWNNRNWCFHWFCCLMIWRTLSVLIFASLVFPAKFIASPVYSRSNVNQIWICQELETICPLPRRISWWAK